MFGYLINLLRIARRRMDVLAPARQVPSSPARLKVDSFGTDWNVTILSYDGYR